MYTVITTLQNIAKKNCTIHNVTIHNVCCFAETHTVGRKIDKKENGWYPAGHYVSTLFIPLSSSSSLHSLHPHTEPDQFKDDRTPFYGPPGDSCSDNSKHADLISPLPIHVYPEGGREKQTYQNIQSISSPPPHHTSLSA